MEITTPTIALKQKPKAIVFDWDNTLVDTWPVITEALNAALASFNRDPWSLDEARKRIRLSMRDSFPKLFGEKWKDAAHVFYEHYGKIHIKFVKPIDGVPAMLDELHMSGIYLCVVSNKCGDYLRREVQHLNWAKYFKKLVGANDSNNDKPSREPVDLALDGVLLHENDKVWFIGDTNIDMECAHNSDCTPILLRKFQPTANEFGLYPPEWHFHDTLELCKWLRNLYR